ncbi:Beta-amyrin 28-monooxygenase [Camellia lanceoleosa]|uniref:Beta-amyrin 28-monooxygenase n=1 Tax=Camellia lanceoleosa TaxID=1840588 RepID=A0ACC0HF96_9ERIC|nr:Beta-amyrin 28-monooxygenase [Camellia lanceoleosa]
MCIRTTESIKTKLSGHLSVKLTFMEAISLSLCVALLVIFLTLCFIFAFKSNSNNTRLPLPPGSYGWPIIGETMKFFYNPEKFVTDRMTKYSPEIFKTKFFNEKIAVICGPNGHKFLFSNDHKLFSQFHPKAMEKLFLSSSSRKKSHAEEGASRDKDLKLVRGPGVFKTDALIHYVAAMDSIIQQKIKAELNEVEVVKAYPFSRNITLTLACRYFLGMEISAERIARLVGYFDQVTLGMHSMPLDFPGTTFYYACKAADVIRKELSGIIQEKKAEMAAAKEGGAPKAQDLLSHMIAASSEDGSEAEAEIGDKIMGLIVAGYGTVSTAITYFMKYVGERPDIYHKILSEQLEISKGKQAGEYLSWDDMQKMKYSWAVICEVMRFTPPVQGNFRVARTDFTYAGYTIPKGWKVFWTVTTTQKNPEYFREPEKFDPSRFIDGDGPPPFTFVPFGGGPRMCPGKEYSRLAVLVFVHNVVKKFKWEVLFPNEKILGTMLPIPEKGLPIRLQPC